MTTTATSSKFANLFRDQKTGRGPYGLRHGWWVLICLAYLISPIDLVPEAILGPLGLFDDAGIAAFGLYSLACWFRNRRRPNPAPVPGVKRVPNTASR